MVQDTNLELGKPFELPEAFTQTLLGTLDRQLDAALAGNPELLVMDLGRVNSIDSPALNWLLATQTRLAGLGIQMHLQNPTALMLDILVATRLDHRFHIVGISGKQEPVDA